MSHSIENYLLPIQITVVPHHTYPGLLWVAIDMGHLVRQPVKCTHSDIIMSCGANIDPLAPTIRYTHHTVWCSKCQMLC